MCERDECTLNPTCVKRNKWTRRDCVHALCGSVVGVVNHGGGCGRREQLGVVGVISGVSVAKMVEWVWPYGWSQCYHIR